MITEETISRVKSSLQATKSFLALEVIEELEKENTELKEKMGSAGFRIAELKMQIENYKLSENESKEIIAELKENHESDKRSLSLIVDKGLKLEAQIEKMKCCENCNKYKKGKCTEDNMFYARTTKQCKEWELAE